MYYQFPLIPKERVQEIVQFIRSQETSLYYDGPMPRQDELALVYSMQSQIFKTFGQCAIAKRFFDKSYQLLYPFLDTALSNFIVIATFAHLAFPLICDGEVDRARFFLENVRTFLSLRLYGSVQLEVSQQERFLKQLYFLATNNLLVGEGHRTDAPATGDLTRVIKTYIYSHCISRQHHLQQVVESKEDWTSPLIADEFSRYLNLIRDDLVLGTDNFHISIDRMEMIAKHFEGIFEATSQGVSFVDVAIQRLQYLLMALGARIQLLERAEPKNKIVISIADQISELTVNPCFKYCTPVISEPVVLSAHAHLHAKNMDKLKKDTTALALLRGKYEIVAIKYGPFIDVSCVIWYSYSIDARRYSS